MLLIREDIDEVSTLLEADESGRKSLYIEGPFIQGNVLNRNKRIYGTPMLAKECDRFRRECIDQGTSWGASRR